MSDQNQNQTQPKKYPNVYSVGEGKFFVNNIAVSWIEFRESKVKDGLYPKTDESQIFYNQDENSQPKNSQN